MPMALKVIGGWLVLDGALSMRLCSDKTVTYQAVKFLRVLIGIALFFIK